MLTIQKANPRALEFYTAKCKYAMDEISPSKSDPYADEGEYDYEIYSKIWDAGAQATLRQKGDEARRARGLRRLPSPGLCCAARIPAALPLGDLSVLPTASWYCRLAGQRTPRRGRPQRTRTRRPSS